MTKFKCDVRIVKHVKHLNQNVPNVLEFCLSSFSIEKH